MQASKLIKCLKFKKIIPRNFEDFTVSLLTQDTREVVENSVFVAVKGAQFDGHLFVQQAIKAGAKLIVAQEKTTVVGVPVVYVNDTKRAMAILSSRFYGGASQALHIIGVTGTNGKTTVTHLIEAIFRAQQRKTGLIGTMYRKIGDEVLPTKNTTPDIITLQRTLSKMVERGVSDVAMEVSSIALIQGRVWGIDFDVAVFTNLTRDHLDYHKTMENYKHAKSLLFSQLGNRYAFNGDPKVAVLNIDDPVGKQFEQLTAAQVLTYGIKESAMISAQKIKVHSRGTDFELHVFDQVYQLHTQMIGMFNVYNVLAAFAAAYASGLPAEDIIMALDGFKGVRGRMQLISSPTGVSAIVDYSHTPDGLYQALKTLDEVTKQHVFCVVGCGGDRDHGKRPKMGEIAAEHSDFPIFTSDNPRSEDPQKIISAMLSGVPTGIKVPTFVDRRQAINYAIQQAQPGDLVLIAGKGHEDYQIIGKQKRHFDDVEEATKALWLKEQAGK
ncbi:UDP-N-acetylmuramoyl-L-alanyl-D-glutamate--2,6-diaminopimelate ligase [Liquorilactobacillus vini]|uniref:UDP-N-acetylmuramoyl-L-alanyl-D-glutamate--2,6-diaminopimelate ligase n=1 Tax=Liquorilactobacillus vini DSM 20605 TaxID=1133569 RepID=A0A0R2CLZ4_9LACO|nr:UDP-N-acetylmuramoyl-L-alanyl-D-glutamate--2,6-diaminopimelate ligase [Liquorilactobacillus vini]KRM89206.1 UDP-N-acetylmuramoylalanyl-D-glutamate--2,6-diaminopimelate ligase [Liquorilactobacillus vini DSM 20605]